MMEGFDLILSKSVTAEEVLAAVVALFPGCLIHAKPFHAPFPDEAVDVLIQLNSTNDPAWPVALDVSLFLNPPPLSALRTAEAIARSTGSNVLTDLHGLCPELDSQDPYWWLAYSEGQWHLADAANTPLMGPYTDGTRNFPGDATVKLVRQVNPWVNRNDA